MKSIRRSVGYSLAEKYTAAALQALSSVVLSRILSPADFGAYAIAMAVYVLLYGLRDFGVGAYVVQHTSLTEARLRSATSVMLLTSWTAAAAIAVSAPWLAQFYDVPQLTPILRLIAISAALLAVTGTSNALLTRELRFDVLFYVTAASLLVSTAVKFSLALQGYGAMSFAWGNVTTSVITTVLLLRFRPAQHSLWPGSGHMREVIHFGVRVSATSIVTQIGVQASTLVLGRVLGVAAVGLYGRAHTLIFLFQQQIVGAIGRVAFPALAEARRAGSAPGPHLLRGVVYVTGVAWPLYGFIICVASPLFDLLFGPQWSASVSVAQVLAIGAAIPAMIPFFGVTLLSLGRVNDLLIGEIILVVARVAVLVVVAPYGLMAVAVSQVVMHAVSFAVWTTVIRRATGLSRRQLLRAASKSVPLAAAGSAGASLLLLATGHVPAWLHVAGSAIFAAGGWLLATWLTKHPLWGEIVRLFLWVKPRVLAYSRSARS